MIDIENYTIKIDVFEKDVIKYFDKEGIPYVIEGLPIGDYIVVNCDGNIERICFERKTIGDFFGSIKSGRLFEQLLNMKNTFEVNYLIIVGYFEDYVKGCIFSKIQPPSIEQWVGTLASINVRYPVKILNVKNHNQMVKLMKKIIEKTDDGQIVEFIHRLKNTDENIRVNMLTALDGISLEKAKRILERFTLYDLFYVGEDQLKEIKGIGIKLAFRIKEIFKV